MPKAGSGTFPYPGSKTTIAPWITEHFSNHECFVEVFGGSASVLMEKVESGIEVYNDINDDLVHFFRTCRNRGAEVSDWLANAPFARSEFETWEQRWSRGWRPADDVRRAGQFLYLQTAGHSGHIESRTFRTQKSLRGQSVSQRITRSFGNQKSNPQRIQERFSEVIVESLDYRNLLEKYDSENSLFYLDPPYYGCEQEYYGEEVQFDHEEFFDLLQQLEANWVVSYSELPPSTPVESVTVVERERKWTMDVQKEHETSSERLVMNYDPDETEMFSPSQQATLGDMA